MHVSVQKNNQKKSERVIIIRFRTTFLALAIALKGDTGLGGWGGGGDTGLGGIQGWGREEEEKLDVPTD